MATHKITGTSPASATTAASGSVAVGKYDAIRIVAVLQGGTGGTLNVRIQASWDGTTFWDIASFAQLADGAASSTRSITLSRLNANTTPTVIGSDLSPALAANTFLDGDFGEHLRAVYTAGSGTSAGTAQTIWVLGSEARAR